MLAVDQALERLTLIDPDQARIVELQFFAGLTVEETAPVLKRSPRTVKREWRLSRAWLYRELHLTNSPPSQDPLPAPRPKPATQRVFVVIVVHFWQCSHRAVLNVCTSLRGRPASLARPGVTTQR